MGALQVAVVDVEADAALAFRSMLGVLQGRMSARWQLVDSVDSADAVVTSNWRLLDEWRRRAGSGRVVAIVGKDDAGARPDAIYVLNHPFRVMQVLSVMDDIAGQIVAPAIASARSATLSADARYRLLRWPDFGERQPDRLQLRLLAALSARPCTRADLMRVQGATPADVDRALEEVSRSGLLQAQGAIVENNAAPAASGFLRGLLGGLRKSLGIGA